MNFIQAVAAARKRPSAAGIVTAGLVFNVDATEAASYPGSGSIWYDTAGSNNGTLTNGASYSPTGGKHIEFDGLDDYVELGTITSTNILSLVGLQQFTIEFWIRPDGSGDSFQRVIDKSNGGSGANGWTIYYTNFIHIQFQIGGSASPAGQIDVTAGIWQQVLVVVDLNANTKTYYTNGGATSASWPEVGTISTTTTNARIGTWNHSTGREWNGGIGAIRIYNRLLTSAEISQNWNAKRGEYGI